MSHPLLLGCISYSHSAGLEHVDVLCLTAERLLLEQGITGREVTSIESYTWQSGRKDDELDHLAAYFQVVELCMAVSS